MKNIGVEDKNINVGGDGDGKDRVYNEYETTYN